MLAAQLMGRSCDREVSSLKDYLYETNLTDDSAAKLDLVMVDDYTHLTELVSEHGMPWWDEDTRAAEVRYVQVHRRWLWTALGALIPIALMAGEGPLWHLSEMLPWQ